MTLRTRDEREDSAYANGVRFCLNRLYAAGLRPEFSPNERHERAFEDCERVWRERTEAVQQSAAARAAPKRSLYVTDSERQ